MENVSDGKREYPFLGFQDLMIELSRFKDLADSELVDLHTNLDPLVSARLHLDKALINAIKDYELFLKSCSSEIAEIMAHKETGLIESDIKRLKKISENAKLINGIITDIYKQLNHPSSIPSFPSSMLQNIINYALNITTDFSNIDSLAKRLDDFVGMAIGKPEKAREASSEYISSDRITEITDLKSDDYDLSALIMICKEINTNYGQSCYIATALLIRTLLNHISKVFGYDTFDQVASNFPFSSSHKKLIQKLQTDLRNIADFNAHFKIDKHIILPDKNQVQFQHNLDILLQYLIIEIKRKQESNP